MSYINKIKNELKRRELKKTLIRREPTAEGYLLYVEMIYEYYYKAPFVRAWWHELFATILIDILAGKVSYTIVSFAPRHRKTDLGVRMFATYAFGMSRTSSDVKNALKLIYATYGGTLSVKTSTESKGIVESEIYKFIFPEVVMKKDTDQKHDWAMKGNAGFFATSVSGAGTGVGADIYMADDLIKASEEGSLITRDTAWKFFLSSVLTRLEGLKSVLMIMQRLHVDDVVGRFEKWAEQNEILDKVTFLNIPALNREEILELKKNEILTYRASENVALINPSKKLIYFEKNNLDGNIEASNGLIYLAKGESVKLEANAEVELRISFEEVYTYGDYLVVRPPYTPLDENLFNLEELEDKRKDAYTWGTQYLQNPKPSEVGFFKKDWMKFVFPHEVDEGAEYIFIDPAESQSTEADNRSINLVTKFETYDKTVKTFVKDGRCGLWDVYVFCHHIFTFGLLYPNAPFYIELGGGGLTLETVLPQELLKFNASQQAKGLGQFTNTINWEKVSNQVAKNTIINLMQFPLSQAHLIFNALMDENYKNQTIKEFKAYNPDKMDNSDDNLDGISKSFYNRECVPRTIKKEKKAEAMRSHKKRKKTNKGWKI